MANLTCISGTVEHVRYVKPGCLIQKISIIGAKCTAAPFRAPKQLIQNKLWLPNSGNFLLFTCGGFGATQLRRKEAIGLTWSFGLGPDQASACCFG